MQRYVNEPTSFTVHLDFRDSKIIGASERLFKPKTTTSSDTQHTSALLRKNIFSVWYDPSLPFCTAWDLYYLALKTARRCIRHDDLFIRSFSKHGLILKETVSYKLDDAGRCVWVLSVTIDTANLPNSVWKPDCCRFTVRYRKGRSSLGYGINIKMPMSESMTKKVWWSTST